MLYKIFYNEQPTVLFKMQNYQRNGLVSIIFLTIYNADKTQYTKYLKTHVKLYQINMLQVENYAGIFEVNLNQKQQSSSIICLFIYLFILLIN